jgi:hypothetical protein
MEILKQALDVVKTFQPMTAEQINELLGRTATAAREGVFEPFKTGNGFDGTAQHPQWLGEADKGPG